MQLRQSSLKGGKVRCPNNCAHKIHGHGSYERNRHSVGCQRIRIRRWLCVVCRLTLSVLPDFMLPYRACGVDPLEGWLEAHYHQRAPPEASELEKGCLERARKRFEHRIRSLSSRLGQMVATPHPTARKLWESLRSHGNLAEILRDLATGFKISLLGDYRCLLPWTSP